jgi:hypothetical protein
MKERFLIHKAWQQVRSTITASSRRQRADEFFALLESNPEITWEEMEREAREKYPDLAPEIFSTIVETDEPLLVHNSLPFAQLADTRVAEVFKRFIRKADPEKHEFTFAFLAAQREMKPELKARRDLPDSVLQALKKK